MSKYILMFCRFLYFKPVFAYPPTYTHTNEVISGNTDAVLNVKFSNEE